MISRHPISTLFPYTTLFRSHAGAVIEAPLHRRRLGELETLGLAEDRIEEIDLAVVAVNRPDLVEDALVARQRAQRQDRKSTRLNSSHQISSYAVFCLKKKKQ